MIVAHFLPLIKMPAGLYYLVLSCAGICRRALQLLFFDDKIGRYSNCALPSVGSPLATLPRCASAISVAVQALQNAKLKIREQVPIFNLRLLYLWCATAVALGLIAVLTLLRSLFPATPRQYQSRHKCLKMRN